MTFPSGSYRHSVSVQPFLGSGGRGDVYGSSQAVPCFRDDSSQLVRDAEGNEVTSSTTVYADPSWREAFPPGSKVTVGDRTAYVISRDVHLPGSLPLSGYLQVHLT